MKRREPTLEERRALKLQIESGELSIAQAVRALRRQLQLTQPEFAKLIDVYPRVVADVENGRGNPTVNTLNKMLGKFGFEVGVVAKRPSKSKIASESMARPA